jgi:hypothetical protein
MKRTLPLPPEWLVVFACIAMAALFTPLHAADGLSAVTVSDNLSSWTLDNGIVKATVTKDNGSMPSLIYRGMQMLAASGGTWEHNPQGAPPRSPTVSQSIPQPMAARGRKSQLKVSPAARS